MPLTLIGLDYVKAGRAAFRSYPIVFDGIAYELFAFGVDTVL